MHKRHKTRGPRRRHGRELAREDGTSNPTRFAKTQVILVIAPCPGLSSRSLGSAAVLSTNRLLRGSRPPASAEAAPGTPTDRDPCETLFAPSKVDRIAFTKWGRWSVHLQG